jgi:prevent-host-death family protein
MDRVSAGQARKDLSSTLNRVAYGRERLILHRRGKDVAALVPIEDLALLEALEARLDLDEARAALAEAKEKGTIPWRKIKAELGL